MNQDARVLTDQVNQILTTKSGLHSMAGTVKTISASWVSKFHTSEESKTLNASMERNSKDKSSGNTVSAEIWTMNAMLGM